MVVRLIIVCVCILEPEDAERIENGEMTLEEIEWYDYMQDSTMELVSIEED